MRVNRTRCMEELAVVKTAVGQPIPEIIGMIIGETGGARVNTTPIVR